ncbi:MAG: hypothetical protein HKN94_14165 [Acidimicrobiales bacterium]|nr:hypothetical protein [Acidimicrobiales bacterium]RZV48083.1 MAG: hypothetical protein EX269_03165 [Acidimicrobiales bacterium]
MKQIPDQTAYTNAPVNIQPIGWDADDDTLTWAASGLPAGLSIDPSTGLISGTIAASEADQLFTIRVKVSDGGLRKTRQFDLTTLQFALSPHYGDVFISEIHFFQVGSAPEHEFVEIVNTGTSPLAGFKLLDFNPLFASDRDTSTFFVPRLNSLAGGERMTIWFDKAVRDPEDAPDAELELGFDQAVLDNFGDDLYLFDADWNLVDYVAYGGMDGNALDKVPTTDVPVWDRTGMLDVFLSGTFYNSLSLASHDVSERDQARCWEYSASAARGFETAIDRGCVNAHKTVDTDGTIVSGILFDLTGIMSPRTTNVGRAEW